MKNITFGLLIGAGLTLSGTALAARFNTDILGAFTDSVWGLVETGDRQIPVFRLVDKEKNNVCYFAAEKKNVPLQMSCVGK